MLPTWLPFEWIVALRFLREGRLQTLFIITGVAIGAAVIVFMSALLSGLQANFIRRVLNAQAPVQLLPAQQVTRQLRGGPVAGPPKTWPKSAASALPAAQTPAIEGAIVQPPLQRLKSIDQWRAVAAQIQALPGVRVVAPVAAGSGLAVRGNAGCGNSLTGIDPALYFRIVDLGGGLPQRRDARPRRGADRQRRPDMLAAQRGRQAQRRPAAARGGGARVGDEPAVAAGRRAHRQP